MAQIKFESLEGNHLWSGMPDRTGLGETLMDDERQKRRDAGVARNRLRW